MFYNTQAYCFVLVLLVGNIRKWMLRTEGFTKWLKLLDFDTSDHRGYILIYSNTELKSIVDYHVLFGF